MVREALRSVGVNDAAGPQRLLDLPGTPRLKTPRRFPKGQTTVEKFLDIWPPDLWDVVDLLHARHQPTFGAENH